MENIELIEESALNEKLIKVNRNIKDQAHKLVEMAASVLPKYMHCSSMRSIGGVYFLKNKLTGLTKIGCTNDFNKRITQLKTSAMHLGMQFDIELLFTIPIVPELKQRLEAYIHAEYSEKRKIGEWFDLSPDDLENIEIMSFEYVLFVIEKNSEDIKSSFIKKHSPLTPSMFGFFGWREPSSPDILKVTQPIFDWLGRYYDANKDFLSNIHGQKLVECLVA